MFKRLQDFKYATGHCNVPQGYPADLGTYNVSITILSHKNISAYVCIYFVKELATWVKNQRQAYRYMLEKKVDDKKPTKRISPDRVTRLNHLGFEWRKYIRAEEWKSQDTKRQQRTRDTNCSLLPTMKTDLNRMVHVQKFAKKSCT
jgi:Helicase associated domain